MQGKFFIIEGLDGCGKSTQLELLKTLCDKQGVAYKYIHFPMLNQGVYGTLIAEFLRGEFGTLEQVHPKLVALLFAGDRMEHINTINGWLDEGYCVLADRYVYSTIAFQCAKLDDEAEKTRLKEWILDYEFNTNLLPHPDRSFFLNVPFSHVEKSLSNARTGNDRDYLNGKQDIHEASLHFQRNVYNEYCKLLNEQDDLIQIDCFDANGNFLPKEEIHQKIANAIR